MNRRDCLNTFVACAVGSALPVVQADTASTAWTLEYIYKDGDFHVVEYAQLKDKDGPYTLVGRWK